MRLRRRHPVKAELVERKHRLEGEINVLRGELRARRAQGRSTREIEAKLDRATSAHYRTRLEIDRAGPS